MVDKQDEIIHEVNDTKDVKIERSKPPWPLITIGIVATVVIVAIVIGGWIYIKAQSQSGQDRMMGRFGSMGQADQQLGQRGMRGGNGGTMRGGAGMIDTNATRGVVTAVSGDTLTISGGGKQVTVKKTATTTISGDKTIIAVNDTVIISGDTASDGTVTATRIVIRNQMFQRMSDEQDESTTLPNA